MISLKTSNTMIHKEILIEELVEKYPQCLNYLREQGIICVVCGEPIWGNLEQLAKSKGLHPEQINMIIQELNKML